MQLRLNLTILRNFLHHQFIYKTVNLHNINKSIPTHRMSFMLS